MDDTGRGGRIGKVMIHRKERNGRIDTDCTEKLNGRKRCDWKIIETEKRPRETPGGFHCRRR